MLRIDIHSHVSMFSRSIPSESELKQIMSSTKLHKLNSFLAVRHLNLITSRDWWGSHTGAGLMYPQANSQCKDRLSVNCFSHATVFSFTSLTSACVSLGNIILRASISSCNSP